MSLVEVKLILVRLIHVKMAEPVPMLVELSSAHALLALVVQLAQVCAHSFYGFFTRGQYQVAKLVSQGAPFSTELEDASLYHFRAESQCQVKGIRQSERADGKSLN